MADHWVYAIPNDRNKSSPAPCNDVHIGVLSHQARCRSLLLLAVVDLANGDVLCLGFLQSSKDVDLGLPVVVPLGLTPHLDCRHEQV